MTGELLNQVKVGKNLKHNLANRKVFFWKELLNFLRAIGEEEGGSMIQFS